MEFNTIKDNKLLTSCIIIGVLTVIIGLMTEKVLDKYEKRDNFLSKLKRNYPAFIITLFMFGVFVHYMLDVVGFEAYCEKKCNGDVCQYVCQIKTNA